MFDFDASQQRVLHLDPAEHARIIGAPGSGKTKMLIESYAHLTKLPGWQSDDVAVLAPNRLVAAALRGAIERRTASVMSGTLVRTAPSFAFAILRRHSALLAQDAPRLLTGTAHDKVIESILTEVVEGQRRLDSNLPIAKEAMLSDHFRAELREFSRVIDDYGVKSNSFAASLRTSIKPPSSDSPDEDLIAQWLFALELHALTQHRLQEEHPAERSASSMIRDACAAVRETEELNIPRLVLVDDASELGEGAVALLAALADRGTKVWVFGDPDISTGAFSGERSRMLAGVVRELDRRSEHEAQGSSREQTVVLQKVYRHSREIRDLVQLLTSRIGVVGEVHHREAESVRGDEAVVPNVRFTLAASQAEQVGAIAHQMRAARLGVGGEAPVLWSQMAVVCRSREEVARVSRLLASHQVPCSVAAGGLVLREHQLVRELVRLLQHALNIEPLSPEEVSQLLGGIVGGLDPISLRRLRAALRVQEVRAAQLEERLAVSSDELLWEAFELPGQQPVLDMRAARRLLRLATLAQNASAVNRAGGTAREVLWQIWEGSGLAAQLQQQALEARGTRSDDAHRALDGVVALFFALQRHEEQDSSQPVEQLLRELMGSTVAQDSLAARSEREVVTVTTPQGVIGREFDLVNVLGLQLGAWPNLRARGSHLGVVALERWLLGSPATRPSRRDTVHDELRLFAQSASRAKEKLLVVAISNADEHPSPFFALGNHHEVEHDLPTTRLTLRGVVAEMRRRLLRDPRDREALDSLAALSRAGVPGAHPDEWYGVRPASSSSPLVNIDPGGPEDDIEVASQTKVPVSPSQMERAETCPLDWIISKLSGADGDYRANIGTLLHLAFETAEPGATAESLLEVVRDQWSSLKFEAKWQSQRALEDTQAMAAGLVQYLAKFERTKQRLLANEASFEIELGIANLRGVADRIESAILTEADEASDSDERSGGFELTVVDLKTGRKAPTAKELEQHAQLQAYQLGALNGAFVDGTGAPIDSTDTVGAKLLYVHPDTLGKTRLKRGEKYLEVTRGGLTEEQQQHFEERVQTVARIMAGNSFVAELEHHCEDAHTPGRSCAIHIVPAVSHS